ncbi:MAG TPA: LysR family transcriptional regulator [Dongiaceae bacterium]|nr:LysR family transcriptional regulator [Dongiaceae bacterium]
MAGLLGDHDLKLLRTFRAIVDSGGFTAAQSALNASLSQLSTQIGELEARLGLRLCQRGRVGFRLTDEGRRVYDASLRLFAGFEDFRTEVGELAGQLVGELRIGAVDNLISHPRARLAQAIARFKQPPNAVKVLLRITGPGELERAVLDGSLQVGIGAFYHHLSGLDYEYLLEETQSLYCGRGHPFFGAKAVPEAEVAAAEFVERGYIGKGRPRGTHSFHRTATAYDMESIAYLVLSGRYIGYLPRHYAKRWVDRRQMQEVEPRRYRYASRFELITRRGLRSSLVVSRFLAALRESHHASPSPRPAPRSAGRGG